MSIIIKASSSVTIEGSRPVLCEAQLLSEANESPSRPILRDANGKEIPHPCESIDPHMILEFHGGDLPKVSMPYIPKDNSAFAHRGLPRKKRW